VVYSGSSQSCSNQIDQSITINGNPITMVSPIGTICQGATPVQLQVNTEGYTGTGVFSGPGVSSTGLFTPSIAGLGTSTINYVFTATNGCTDSTSQQVNVEASPVITVDSVFAVLQGGEVVLGAKASGSGLTYKWSPSTGLNQDNILDPIASPNQDTQYTLTVTSADSCIAVTSVFVSVLKNIVIPNAFTPNGDGINDNWDIQYINSYPNCTVQIFNRYGEQVYYSVGYPIPWDGKYKGSNLPVGTYYYIIDPKSGRKPVSGYVTIIR